MNERTFNHRLRSLVFVGRGRERKYYYIYDCSTYICAADVVPSLQNKEIKLKRKQRLDSSVFCGMQDVTNIQYDINLA